MIAATIWRASARLSPKGFSQSTLQPSFCRSNRERQVGDHRRGDVHGLQTRDGEQLLEVRRPQFQPSLFRQGPGPLRPPGPDRHRFELLQLLVGGQGHLGPVTSARNRDLHRIVHCDSL
ncbi:MAG: hypothetical protein M3P34_02035 [Actinomycetota bacterium]|nr:hypothetical protein [Actinomycetota bacterium]